MRKWKNDYELLYNGSNTDSNEIDNAHFEYVKISIHDQDNAIFPKLHCT